MKGDLPLTPEDVNEIVSILENSQYDRLDIKTHRFRLRVVRTETGDGFTQEWSLVDEEGESAAATAPAAEEFVVPEGLTAIRAPLPGTFYRAPSPGADPFVELGATVGPDDNVGIIETMKLFNPVPAKCSGEIVEIVAENATMVDAGTVLMLVK